MLLSRRRFFRTLPAAAGLVPGVNLLGVDQPKQNMITQSSRPEDLEMALDGFGHWITPVERFYVRSHVYTPKVDIAQWQLRIEGHVQNEQTLTMADLRKLPRVELVSVVECAGNGRAFYEPTLPGVQWRYGAVGNARWSGVRLSDVLKKANLKGSAREVLFNGADVPIGTMPDFIRTVPIDKSLDPDTLLAFEMNGAPLAASHGFPLRVVVPGWAGDSWVKWITNIQILDKEYDGFWMKTAYRRPVRPVAPGTAVDPAEMTPVTYLRPKSVIASPIQGQKLPLAPIAIRGAAWSGEHPVSRVEVSMDSGRTWQPAKLGPDQAKYAWRLWEATWKPAAAGSYVLMARATDAGGNTQPFVQDWNPSGYLWNVVHPVRIEVGVSNAAEPPTSAQPPTGFPPFPAKVKTACIGCHGEDIIAGQKMTRAQWERDLDKMIRWGAQVKPEDRAGILDFLAREFGPRR